MALQNLRGDKKTEEDGSKRDFEVEFGARSPPLALTPPLVYGVINECSKGEKKEEEEEEEKRVSDSQ